jgi:serine/threonine-protein kinase
MPSSLGQFQLDSMEREEPNASYYRATNAAGEPVEVAVLRPEGLDLDSDDAAERIAGAVGGLKYVSGSNVAPLLESGRSEGFHYLVREASDWPSLRSLLAEQRRADLSLVISVARGAAQGLAELSASGVDHGDLRPENILVGPDGEIRLVGQDVVKAVNAVAVDDALRLRNAEYMSPEQAGGQPRDIRSDLYSLGVVLYEALTGEVPFRGESLFATARQHIIAPVPSITRLRPQLPASLVQVVERCLAKQPGDRYQTPAELLEAVTGLDKIAVEDTVRRGSATQAISREDLQRAREAALQQAQVVSPPEPPSPSPSPQPAPDPLEVVPPAMVEAPAEIVPPEPAPAPAPVPPAAPLETPAGGSRAALFVVIAIVVALIIVVALVTVLRAAGAL